jgi:hypothetical protein
MEGRLRKRKKKKGKREKGKERKRRKEKKGKEKERKGKRPKICRNKLVSGLITQFAGNFCQRTLVFDRFFVIEFLPERICLKVSSSFSQRVSAR